MTLSARLTLSWIGAFLVGSCLSYAGAHPTRVDDQSNCLECHADHATGVHIHTAVKRGCTACHNIENRDDASYVVLKATNSIVCVSCHQAETFQYPHFPYTSGMCTRCHDPHASVNPRLLRAKVNDLCLSCHLQKPESTPSRYMPTIALTSDNRIGHPYERHPVSRAPDPLTGGEMSCISCHLPHGAGKLHLLKMASEIPEDALNQNTETNDMCRKCHMRLWGLDGSSGNKKNKSKRKGK